MKKLLFLFAILIARFNTFAVIDTLRYYNTAIASSYYSSATYPKQYASFKLPAPGFIQSIIVKLGGSVDSGSATLHIYGHEGGASFPQFKNDIIPPVTINKTASGMQKVTVVLSSPLWMDNNMFFIEVSNFSTGVQLIRDNTNHTPFCSATDGGDYYLQFMENGAGNLYYGTKAYAIDIVIDYPEGLISPNYLQDVTAAAGIDTNISNSNVSFGDINKDGNLDLLVAGKLYKNLGNSAFTDITAPAGIIAPNYISTFMDMNNDGREDILFVNTDNQYNIIYVNNGNETFTPTPFTLPSALVYVQTISIADFNNDKYPDLFLGQLWEPYPTHLPNYLYINNQNLGFTDASALLNIPENRPVRGSQWVDYNNDGQLDLYVANYYLMQDELWQNNGNGTFTNVIYSKNIDFDSQGGSGHGTGCDWADYDNDGDMDLLLPSLAHQQWVTQYDHRSTTIYQNTGFPDYNFNDLKGLNGVQYEETHAGANWGDLNNDGLLDFAICTFYGCRFTDVYMQKTDHNFELKSFEFGVNTVASPADLVMADFDNDGKLDLACGDNQSIFRLYKNNHPNTNSYVEIDLVSASGNTLGVGAKVVIYAGGNKYTQYQMPYHGAKMSKGNRIHFGLGNATSIDSVVVRWPDGSVNTEKFIGITINNYNILTEGGGVQIGITEPSSFYSSIQVYPNPASAYIIFNYELNASTTVSLDIYNTLGTKISVINNEEQSAGKYAIQWQTKDMQGNKLAPGIYSYHLQANEWIKTGLLIIGN